jgi:hypothetical protein
MNLNEHEKSMLTWLRKQHDNWKSTRVIIAIGAIILLGGAVWGIYEKYSIYSIVPWIALGAYCLSYSVTCWSGRPEISLLLKLMEDHSNRQDSQIKK